MTKTEAIIEEILNHFDKLYSSNITFNVVRYLHQGLARVAQAVRDEDERQRDKDDKKMIRQRLYWKNRIEQKVVEAKQASREEAIDNVVKSIEHQMGILRCESFSLNREELPLYKKQWLDKLATPQAQTVPVEGVSGETRQTGDEYIKREVIEQFIKPKTVEGDTNVTSKQTGFDKHIAEMVKKNPKLGKKIEVAEKEIDDHLAHFKEMHIDHECHCLEALSGGKHHKHCQVDHFRVITNMVQKEEKEKERKI